MRQNRIMCRYSSDGKSRCPLSTRSQVQVLLSAPVIQNTSEAFRENPLSRGRRLKTLPFNMIEDINKNLPHEVSELICLKCLHRWIGVYPKVTPLKDIVCVCGESGYVIKTGQNYE